MANPSLGDTCSVLHSVLIVATPGSALVPEPSSNLPSRTDASAMVQFSMELRELEAVNALTTHPKVLHETQLDTQAIMHDQTSATSVCLSCLSETE